MDAAAALLIAAVENHDSGMLQEPWGKTNVRQQEYLTQLRVFAPDSRNGNLGS